MATTASDGSIGRYYDPGTAQFLSVDPAIDVTGQPYQYAADDPVNETDPTGQSWWNPVSWFQSNTGVPKPKAPIRLSPTSATFCDTAGCIYYQSSPNGTTAWGINTYGNPAGGRYNVDIYVNGSVFDKKRDYVKGTAHGSIPCADAPMGSVISIKATWTPPPGSSLPPAFSVPNKFVATGPWPYGSNSGP